MEETFDTSPFRRHNTENAAYVVNCYAQGNRCLSAFSEIAKKFLKSVLTWFNNTRRFNFPDSLLFTDSKVFRLKL